jgi:hypothetical protein
MAQKSFFDTFTGVFSKKSPKSGGSTLSANQALNAQRNYISADNDIDLSQLPPYLEIVKQLYSPKTEILVAALYYLRKIAANEPNEAAGILAALNNCLNEKNKIIVAHKELIKQAIKKLTASL